MKYDFFHIIVYEEKFTPQLVVKLNQYFLDKKTYYCLVDKKGRNNFPKELFAHNNVMIYNGIRDFWKAFKIAKNTKFVIYNALFYRFFLQMQLLLLGILKKKVWVVWSADMYLRDCSTFLKKLYNRFLISRFSYVATPIFGDFEAFKRIWGFEVVNLPFWFPFSRNILSLSKKTKKQDCIYIQVGNSGHITNQHLQVLEILKKYKDKNIKLILPMSYSCSVEYREEVKRKFFEVFGKERVLVLEENLKFQEYVELMGQIDIGIFNHYVQEAGHNIVMLLALGKKVYINPKNTLLNMSKNIFKVDVFEIGELENCNFETIVKWSGEKQTKNMEIMQYYVSDDFFIDQIDKFYSILENNL